MHWFWFSLSSLLVAYFWYDAIRKRKRLREQLAPAPNFGIGVAVFFTLLQLYALFLALWY